MQESGLIALVVSIFAARMIGDGGFRKLDNEQKLRLIDGFSTPRLYSAIATVLLLVLFWYLISQRTLDQRTILLWTSGLALASFIERGIWK
ncbi:MAG: hypothetical protein ACKO81_16770, partial [Planctomycetota bacterium]